MNYKISQILALIVLIAICINSVYRMKQINFIQDDAYITLRYVENFISGNGLVFNQSERVEGYTNLLWLLLLSFIAIIVKIFSMQVDMSLISQLFSLLFSLVLLVFSFYFTKRFLFEKYPPKNNFEINFILIISLIPPLLISFSTPFIYWGVSGMESTLFTFLVLFSVFRYLFNDKKKFDLVFVAVLVLNTVLRPEGLLIFILIVAHSFIINRKKINTDATQTNVKLMIKKNEIILYVILFLILMIFRLIYYGYPLPNTFYAKTGFNLEHFNRGLEYVINGIGNQFIYGFLLFVPIINFRRTNICKETFFFFFFVGVYLFFIAIIGGDVLPIDRFLLPVLPLVIIFSSITIYQITEINLSKTRKIIFLLIVTFIFSYITIYNSFRNYDFMYTKRSYEVGLVKKMKFYAEWIKKNAEKNNKEITVALSTIGAFSYFSNAKVIDIVGLTDEHIAHNPKEIPGIDEELPVLWKERRYNAEYVLQRGPDFIIFPAGAKPTAFAECAIFIQPNFYKNYYCQLVYSDELKQLLPIFTKRVYPLQTELVECNVKFLKPFIEANNIFLEMNRQKKINLLSKIIYKCNEAENLCSFRKSDIDAVRGYSYYHSGSKEKAKMFFESSIAQDSLNMISRFYLFKLYNEEGEAEKIYFHYNFLKKYSPDIFAYNFIME